MKKDGTTDSPDHDWFPKLNFKPIKAPGNQCQKEFNWASSDNVGDTTNLDIYIKDVNGRPPSNNEQVHFKV